VVVSDMLMLVYALGWPLASVGLIVAARWLRDRWRPAPGSLGITCLAGAIWPLLLLGLAQFAIVAATAKVLANRSPEVARSRGESRTRGESWTRQVQNRSYCHALPRSRH
jgi:hypothetical protein